MNYELMFAVTPGALSKSFADSVEKSVKDAGASAIKVSNLGKKQLAYPIKRNTEGEYYLINFEAEGEAIKAIGDKLRLEQEVLLRYLIIKSHKGVLLNIPEVSEVPEVPKVTAKVTVQTQRKQMSHHIKQEAKSTKTSKPKSKAKAVKKSTKAKGKKSK